MTIVNGRTDVNKHIESCTRLGGDSAREINKLIPIGSAFVGVEYGTKAKSWNFGP